MNVNQKCARAIAAVLGVHAGAAGYAAAAVDQSNEATGGLEEIVVTAQRRAENIQDVPIAIQAFTGETLAQLNVSTFDDLIRYLPNVTAPTAGPGQAQIYMRGLSAGSQASQYGGSITGFPNVAIYLDEQSAQLPGRNLDVYAADLERVAKDAWTAEVYGQNLTNIIESVFTSSAQFVPAQTITRPRVLGFKFGFKF